MNQRLRKKTYQYNLTLFYSKIGEIVNIFSMIEYNLIQIISEKILLSKIDRKESLFVSELNEYIEEANEKYASMNEYSVMKDLIDDAFGNYGLSLELKNKLHCARKKRNYYIHDLFQEDIKGEQWIFKNPKHYFKEINCYLEELYNLNNNLILIDCNNKDEIRQWE